MLVKGKQLYAMVLFLKCVVFTINITIINIIIINNVNTNFVLCHEKHFNFILVAKYVRYPIVIWIIKVHNSIQLNRSVRVLLNYYKMILEKTMLIEVNKIVYSKI